MPRTRARLRNVMATVLVSACVPALALPGVVRAEHGTFTKHTSPAPGAREYWLYVPSPADYQRPLVIFLHGCLQSAADAAKSTRFNDLADRLDFVVAYPQQLVATNSSAPLADGNGAGCWNWFLPDDQARDAGEPATIAGIARALIASENIDPDRVYVDGISAGADMAVILGATYPDLFAAVGAIAGCAYATCTDASGALAYRAMGERARVVPMFVEQGTADTLNAFPLGQGLVQSWLGTDDLADDGAANGSIARAPASIEHRAFDQTPSPGSGNACIHPSNWPCPGGVIGFQDTYPHTIEQFVDARGCDVLDFWVIHGMEHAYPHADPSTAFSDPLGPDITAAAYAFFASHPRGACPAAR